MAKLKTFAGKTPEVGSKVWIADNASIIGDVVIGDRSSIWFGTVVRGDSMPIRIGRETSVQDNTVVHVTHDLSGTIIGDRVTVGHAAIIHACTVEDDCIIGMGAILLDRAHIGAGSIIGAGALISPGTVIPPGSLVVGSPGRVKRAISTEERQWIASSAQHYVELSNAYLTSG